MLVERLRDLAIATPSAPAMVCNGVTVSYARFGELIQAARHALIAASVPRSGQALLTLEDIAMTWPWLLACQSLGLTTITVQPALAASLDIQPLACIIGDGAEALQAPVRIDAATSERLLIQQRGPLDGPIAAAGHLMTSSGTTGLPKIVHSGPESIAAIVGFPTAARTYHQTSVTYVGAFPLATAVGYISPLRSWWFGGGVVIDQTIDHWAPFETGEITEAFLTPGMLSQLMDLYPDTSAINPRMNLTVVGGLTPWPLVQRAMARLTPNISAYYGTTEVSRIGRTPLTRPEDTFLYVVDDHRAVQIVDEQDQPRPVGQTGIVRIDTSVGIHDYWRDPDTTRTFFRHGWFYPGDLGRLHADGRLELLGRANDVLIIGGDKRPAQLFEQAIRDAVPVRDVCIVQSPVRTGADTLNVYYEASEPLSETAIAVLKSRLPADIAVVVTRLDRLPRNVMGKITRLALRSDLSGVG